MQNVCKEMNRIKFLGWTVSLNVFFTTGTQCNHEEHEASPGRRIIVVASFMGQLLAYGSPQSVGVLYPEWLNTFQDSKGMTAWVGSLVSGVGLIASKLSTDALYLINLLCINICFPLHFPLFPGKYTIVNIKQEHN